MAAPSGDMGLIMVFSSFTQTTACDGISAVLGGDAAFLQRTGRVYMVDAREARESTARHPLKLQMTQAGFMHCWPALDST
jgi:hypothetical protein